MNIKSIVRIGMSFAKDHKTELLLGASAVSFTSAVILAVKATPEALDNILAKENEVMSDPEEVEKRLGHRSESPFKLDLTFGEAFSSCWKQYIPAAVGVGVGIGCMVCSGMLYSKKIAAIGAAYALSEQAVSTYQNAIADAGNDVAEKVRDKIAENKLSEVPVPDKKDIPVSEGSGMTLCFDPMIGKYYYSDYETHRSIINDVNEMIVAEGEASWAEYYEMLQHYIPTFEVPKFSEDFIWKEQMRLDPSSSLAPDGKPCLVIEFANHPEYQGYGW